jgi:hypothetical protein
MGSVYAAKMNKRLMKKRTWDRVAVAAERRFVVWPGACSGGCRVGPRVFFPRRVGQTVSPMQGHRGNGFLLQHAKIPCWRMPG